MAQIILEPFDKIKFNDNGVVGMVLPCGRVITFEGGGRTPISHADAEAPKNGEFTILRECSAEISAEMIIAFRFAELAFKINSANTKQTP